MENIQETTEVLNDLIQINNDRITGYERALKELRDDETNLRTLFLTLIKDSQRYKMELGTEIEVLGKDMETGTTTSGKLHRAWMDVKAAFTAHDTHDILEECEFGEDAILKTYNKALEEEYLPAYLRQLITAQQAELLIRHNEIKALRDSVQ
ncbi:PA2169 family four-helix-bundle protein [Mucilaginibacter pocheonensis]|uniref:Uncharacterized protein (TIGR02284 family) n=1 Tax=Mucilaginibacter pocheonensis TaxID=398050 RepID=A0ABU1TH88_9SPHI|nr:PA2169 family four-helix-bundle protein [Mucilaginibacter pocheonensis]MDR6944606.1 uncharacterized protein (TIGR02284 family) [Mucilaginibacter pocheonensis]